VCISTLKRWGNSESRRCSLATASTRTFQADTLQLFSTTPCIRTCLNCHRLKNENRLKILIRVSESDKQLEVRRSSRNLPPPVARCCCDLDLLWGCQRMVPEPYPANQTNINPSCRSADRTCVCLCVHGFSRAQLNLASSECNQACEKVPICGARVVVVGGYTREWGSNSALWAVEQPLQRRPLLQQPVAGRSWWD
jgi:hypothetical protein